MLSQEKLISEIVEAMINADKKTTSFTAPLGVSNRHIHLSQADVETLFGPGYTLHESKPLLQPGQYATSETLVVAGPKGSLQKVRILGPTRSATQVELLRSDGFALGIDLPVRDSGCPDPSPSITLIGPKGAVTLHKGVLAAWRHIHISDADAGKHGLKDGDIVQLKTSGDRAVIFDHVKVRTGDFLPEVHIDVDEANSACVSSGDLVEVISV